MVHKCFLVSGGTAGVDGPPEFWLLVYICKDYVIIAGRDILNTEVPLFIGLSVFVAK